MGYILRLADVGPKPTGVGENAKLQMRRQIGGLRSLTCHIQLPGGRKCKYENISKLIWALNSNLIVLKTPFCCTLICLAVLFAFSGSVGLGGGYYPLLGSSLHI